MDSEKKYNRALEIIRPLYQRVSSKDNPSEQNIYLANIFEDAFPELRESEDEKMRKIAIEACKYMVDNFENSTQQYEDAIVWLEEQGEQKPIDPDTLIQQRVDALADIIAEQKPDELDENKSKELSLSLQIQAYLNTASDELYAKGKPLYSEEKIKDIHKCMLMWQKLHNAYFYQKIAWSEEDEKNLLEISCLIGNYRTGDDEYKLDSWLNSLKNRVQSKQEWSEEEENLLTDTEYLLRVIKLENRSDNEYQRAENCLAWLKSLRPQSQWKPSEKQMKALDEAVHGKIPESDALWYLYNDLKNLIG